MPIRRSCPRCTMAQWFDDVEAGRASRCRGCGYGFVVPGSPPSVPAPAARVDRWRWITTRSLAYTVFDALVAPAGLTILMAMLGIGASPAGAPDAGQLSPEWATTLGNGMVWYYGSILPLVLPVLVPVALSLKGHSSVAGWRVAAGACCLAWFGNGLAGMFARPVALAGLCGLVGCLVAASIRAKSKA